MKEIKELTGLYSLTKTIGVELIPVGKTQELIEAKKLIEQDDQRAEDYKIVKDIIDRYHRQKTLIEIQKILMKSRPKCVIR